MTKMHGATLCGAMVLIASLAVAIGCKKEEASPTGGAATGDDKKAGDEPAKDEATPPATDTQTGAKPTEGGDPPATASADGWTDFSSSEGRFAAKFPGKPESQNLPTPTAVGNVNQTMFSVTTASGFYAASFADYPETAMKDAVPATVLDGARDGAVTNVQGKLAKEEQIAIDGHPGRSLKIEATPQGQAITVDARIFLVKNRLYQMIVVRPGGTGGDAEVTRFFDSFRLAAK